MRKDPSPGQLTQRKFARWPISAPQSPQSVGVSGAMTHCVTEPANHFFVFWSKSAPWWRHALDQRAKNREICANIYQRKPKNSHPSRTFLSVKKAFPDWKFQLKIVKGQLLLMKIISVLIGTLSEIRFRLILKLMF